MISFLLAGSITFTALATGVEKGTSVEFMFAGAESDRDYETMFLLEKPVKTLVSQMCATGLMEGRSLDSAKCFTWPEGCKVELSPAITNFVSVNYPSKIPAADAIFTSTKIFDDSAFPFFAFYSHRAAPIQFDGNYNQGDVYGVFKALETLPKGEKVEFRLTWDDDYKPLRTTKIFNNTNLAQIVGEIRNEATQGPISILAAFDAQITIENATKAAMALQVIDSPKVKINGRQPDNFFYLAFLPPIKWRDRNERIMQPFEITLSNGVAQVKFIEQDWSVAGNDPKLTEKPIKVEEMGNYKETDTVFFYVKKSDRVGDYQRLLAQFPKSIKNHYFFAE